MGFVNFEKYNEKFDAEPMKGNIERLVDFELFHALIKGSMSASLKVSGMTQNVPVSLLNWLKICDGGLLFDTVVLSTKAHDDDTDMDLDTYEEINNDEVLSDFGLPSGYFVFAIRSYGDPICFSTAPDDDKIYCWSSDDGDFSDIWSTFEDWITEEIDDGIHLIADDALDPLGIKLDGEEDE